MNSIRVFLVAVILATILLFNFISSLQGYRTSMAEAELLFDSQLVDTTKLIANLYADATPPAIDHTGSVAFQIWGEDHLMARSANAPLERLAGLAGGFDYSNFDGYRWRTYAHRDERRDLWVIAAERSDMRFTLAENLVLESLIPNLLSLPVVGLLIWLIVTQGLLPLSKLARELRGKQPDDLSPLKTDASKQELVQIVQSIDQLLDRLDSSLRREKQFASDAAHELRTPISALKVQLYNIAQELPGDQQTVAEVTETADRLSHLVDQILDLYRNSSDQYAASLVELDLGELAREILAREYAQFEHKHQELEYVGESAIILGEPFALTTMLQNLLSNASKYTPERGRIRVEIRDEGAKTLLTVEDSGPGIPSDKHQSVFERFYRVGGDRHDSGEQGCGLGLAIVKNIVDLHRGSITIGPSRFASGCAFCVSFAHEGATDSTVRGWRRAS